MRDGVLAQAPATLARVPAAGRRSGCGIGCGGGEEGNVAAHALMVLRDPIRGVQVTNPEPASGGAPAETVDNAFLRGPEDMHSLRRAVTARDFEALAVRSSGSVARAKAFTKAELWTHAKPGTVEMLLVPTLGNIGAARRRGRQDRGLARAGNRRGRRAHLRDAGAAASPRHEPAW